MRWRVQSPFLHGRTKGGVVMSVSYMEMIYIDDSDNARQTGVRAAFKTNAETWAQFQKCRVFAVSKGNARFLLDYYNSRGDLGETILLDAFGFEYISNEKAKSDAKYRKTDSEYWAAAIKQRDLAIKSCSEGARR